MHSVCLTLHCKNKPVRIKSYRKANANYNKLLKYLGTYTCNVDITNIGKTLLIIMIL